MINHYQTVARTTAIYPIEARFTYPALGLIGEIGETIDKLIPDLPDGGQAFVDVNEACKELGDVLWYITNTGHDAGITLEDMALDLTGGLDVKSFKALHFALKVKENHRSPFLSIVINAAVVAEAAKKAIRDNEGRLQTDKIPVVRKALGLCLRAFLDICDRYLVNPDDAAIINIEKLTRRRDEGKLQGDGDNR